MRATSTILRAAAVVLAVACGGKIAGQRSDFGDGGGGTADPDTGSCFCAADTSTPPFVGFDDGGVGFGDGAGFDAGLPPCPTDIPEAGSICPDYGFDECTYVVSKGEDRTCHWHCRCIVIPEEQNWSCVPDLDCDP